ncbi:carbohydrate ABC transporter substrate-binding protein [Neobacillus notoginsengisoli]|uniref:Probable sugar-binding periplasmic protein n=1 Tax=Neobacillus notoginsengisoli TaxID=1578198 RepID=A0A417YYL7_9BACI|nr:ABC transporter substrate-binding protein [Neobacillus notoginsengisoli]RHW42858.1 carbohydrate ABC transporter substrate-binding protein [Neobacillus notoginsengisoli]
MKKNWSIILTILLVSVLALAGCSSDSTSGEKNTGKGKNKEATLDIFSWWTGAGEEDGLKALIELFKEKHPDVKVENAAVAGGAGTNAKAVLASRMQGNDPPATFQVHGGAELNEGWVAAGKMEALDDLYDAEGWKEKFPQELIDLVSKDGKIYSVPVNIHRGNVLWYNKKIFADNNLEAPKSFDDFFKVADALKAKGITPLALGDKEPWTATHLFESVLLGTMGPDNFKKLWTGEVGFDDPKVKEAAEIFKKMMAYVNEDHSSRNWQDASQLVGTGEAAMNVMGDWAKGYFSNDLKLKADEDFGWVATPGTDGMFMVITDTFGLPKGVKNPEDVKKWLAVLGSVEGQDAFNPLKGSIPARTDADKSKYDVYGQQTIDDFKTSSLAASIAHGSAAPEGFVTKMNQAINIFVTQQKVDQFIESLKEAASELK